MSVSFGRSDTEQAVINTQNCDIKRSASQVIDSYCLWIWPQAECQSRCCWFVNDAWYIQTSLFTSLPRCLSSRFVEVGWYRNNRFGDSPTTQCRFCIIFQLP